MTTQPLSPEDAPAMAAMRQATSAHNGEPMGPEARPMFAAMFAATPAAADVRVQPATVGGIAGFWLRPANARQGARMLYLHGGGYVLGSAQAVTNFAGQIAARVGADAFVLEYRLAPEQSVSQIRGGVSAILLVGCLPLVDRDSPVASSISREDDYSGPLPRVRLLVHDRIRPLTRKPQC